MCPAVREIFLILMTASFYICYTLESKLMEQKKTLVMGATENPGRYANIAINRLVAHNVPTEAIGLRKGMVAGVEIKTEKYPFPDIDTVTLYLGPPRQVEYYDYILSLNPRRVIFNPGTENPEFYKLLREKGVDIEVACTLVMLSTRQY